MRSLTGIKLVVFVAMAILTAPVFAQTDTKAAKADVVFELSLSKFLDLPMVQKSRFDKKVEKAITKSVPNDLYFTKLVRVFACLRLPKNLEKLEDIHTSKGNDMEFLIRLEFATANAAQQMIEKSRAEGSTYLPADVAIYKVNEKTLELTSKGFAGQSIDALLSAPLATAWKAMPDAGLKVSIDSVEARGFLKQLVKAGKKRFDPYPINVAFMDLLLTTDNINLSFDLASANLLTLKVSGSGEDTLTDINDGLKSMLSIVKLALRSATSRVLPAASQPAVVFNKLADDMSVTRNGNTFTLLIPRPEGFDEAVAAAP